jgi:type I restriction enzyme R subunit
MIDGEPHVIVDPPSVELRKYYFDGGQVEIVAELVYELDADGKQLRVVTVAEVYRRKGADALRWDG